MFLFKKIVAPMFFPVSICLEILLFGVILLWFTRKQKAGKIIVSIGLICFAVLSFEAVPNMILHSLEYEYPPILEVKETSKVNRVVVLGGGHVFNPKLPLTSQISESSLIRLVEGIRLQKMLAGGKLVLSGGGAFEPVSNAEIMAKTALILGVNKHDIILESSSRDTKEEAILLKDIIGKEKFFLVTSASHMLRAMALFKKEGMNPIPAPTGHWIKERQRLNPTVFFPGAGNLLKAERAVYEYLGFAWAKIQGQI